MTTSPGLKLRDGGDIPQVGLGVFQAPPGRATYEAVESALTAGYRHIDTARAYRNERDVGEALRASAVPRDEVFVTSKLWTQDFDDAPQAIAKSLERLGPEPIDLYLLHWPVEKLRLSAWRALEDAQNAGQVRHIGVSNFMVSHLEELKASARVMPCVNQIEITPFHQQVEPREWCAAHDIVVEAYSPLARAQRFDDATLTAVAHDVGRTPAQVMLRWAIQHDLVVLPKSVKPARIRENLALFDFTLNAEQMARLDDLEEEYVLAWDPRRQA